MSRTTLCLVIYHTIFDSDGNMSRRPFVWLFITRFFIRIGICQGGGRRIVARRKKTTIYNH